MTIDMSRRRAVMDRSQKLGHCICNPKHPCPCPPLIEQNVCPCAGERLPVKQGQVALTRHVRKAGCASKIGQADLLSILSGLPSVTDPNVLVGTSAGDDAGVYKLDDRNALVQTVDVFTPCVDDPYLFGQIAAANSVSDVYAMGGRPISALSIIGFPIDELDGSIMQQLLRGGIDKLAEADCSVIGGHSINDEEIKCGFAVTGLIDPSKPVQRDTARPGDVLVLTKPLGTGMVSFAAQLGLVSDDVLAEVGGWMAALNRDAAELMLTHDAHACTDVTGFGLAGHLVSMVRGSGVTAEIDLSAVPVFGMVPECIQHEVFGGAVDRNQAYAMGWVSAPEADGTGLPVLYDPQTSGGLLVALPEERARAFVDDMQQRGHDAVAVIGRIAENEPGRDGLVRVVNAELGRFVGLREPMDLSKKRDIPADEPAAVEYEDVPCCEDPPDLGPTPVAHTATPETITQTETSQMDDPLGTFKQFMAEANKPGRIDARAKKLMAIVLAIAHHCDPCLKIHLQGAVKMGIPKEEIDEAVALAVEFGGCTSMMFYRDACQELGL
ncbi:MAG: selenide, water dikinase SelD [bacterium]|nr:selenide, water dikinase SelD [bacterium]